ncbi:MAG: hypothetical protein AAGG47_22090, partial [Pseudomonadota bacterium]
MSGFEWVAEDGGDVFSRDPYGDWASRLGADFLIDYKGDLKGNDGLPWLFAVLSRGRLPDVKRRFRVPFYGEDSADTEAIGPDGLQLAALTAEETRNLFSVLEEAPELVIPLALRRDSAAPERRDGDAAVVAAAADSREAEAAGDDRAFRNPSLAGVRIQDGDTICCVIDHATVFTHENFRVSSNPNDADHRKTRVLWAWMQEGQYQRRDRLPFGGAVTKPEIDAVLGDTDDPEEIMRRVGLADLARDQQPVTLSRMSHGTAVADIAAGEPVNQTASLRSPGAQHGNTNWIMSVGLPSFANWDHSGAGLVVFVTFAMHHLFHRVRQVIQQSSGVRRPRIVINLSYGISGGPHDGTGLFERHIDALIEVFKDQLARDGIEPRVALTMPSGNGFQSRRHANAKHPADEKAAPRRRRKVELELPWRLSPGDRTSSFLEVWLPGDARRAKLTVTQLGGEATEWDLGDLGPKVDLEARLLRRHGQIVGRLSYDQPLFSPNLRRLVLAVAPSDTTAAPGYRVPGPQGLWHVVVEARIMPGEDLRA